MSRVSAGLLVYRFKDGTLEVLIAHPGGPYWSNREKGAWTIPKGEVKAGERLMSAAYREFQEELGILPPQGIPLALDPINQKGGKTVVGWALEGDVETALLKSTEVEIEWPPRSGHKHSFPEIDQLRWCRIDLARDKLVAGQEQLIDQLVSKLSLNKRLSASPEEESRPEGGSQCS